MLTEEKLLEIEARCKAATPGQWKAEIGPLVCVTSLASEDWDYNWNICDMDNNVEAPPEQCELDAAFIAHARQDVPDLLEEVAQLRESLRECREFDKVESWARADAEREVERLMKEVERLTNQRTAVSHD
jgi:hypothetical protein